MVFVDPIYDAVGTQFHKLSLCSRVLYIRSLLRMHYYCTSTYYYCTVSVTPLYASYWSCMYQGQQSDFTRAISVRSTHLCSSGANNANVLL